MAPIEDAFVPREGRPEDSEKEQDTDSSPSSSATRTPDEQSRQGPTKANVQSGIPSEQPSPEERIHRRQFEKKRYYLGLDHNARIKQHHDGAEHLWWSRQRSVLQEPLSEFLGTLVLTLILQGGVAQATLSVGYSSAPGGDGFGSFLTVPFVTGIGVMMGVYIAGDSGSYLNPSITFANCLFRGLSWRSFPSLFLAQVLAAFVGSGITYGIYEPAINAYSGGALLVPPTSQATASIFTSFPQPFSSRGSQFFSVIERTAIMQCVISALKDDYNLGARIASGGTTNFPNSLFWLFFGLTAAFGWETAGQVNPALDLGGRMMASALGYPSTVWTVPSTFAGYPWIPVIGPFIGSCFGAWLYDVFVFTGVSPVNTPGLGLVKIFSPLLDLRNRRARYAQRKDDETGLP